MSSTQTPDVSFVMVTYGTAAAMIDDSLDRLVSSLSFDRVAAEVIIVDNPHPVTGHATGHHLALSTSGIRLALPDQNLGFGGGNERGIGAARAPTICLMNPDLMVHDGWLAPMLEHLAQYPGDVIAPILLDESGDVDEAGQLVGPDGRTAAAPLDAEHIDYASAACWLMTAATHERVGGFDARFHPAYFEDVDYAFRLRQLGQQIRLHPTVAVTHLRGGSTLRSSKITDVSDQLATFNELWGSELWRQQRLPAS